MPDPLILTAPTQQNDFTARAIAFPNDPLPGNLVDGEFAHVRSILGVAVQILQNLTSPDGLSIGQVIGLDQLTPGALDALAQTVTDAVASDTANAQGAAVEAAARAVEATARASDATIAATAAIGALTVIEGAQAATIEAISALTPTAQESADDASASASVAVTAKEEAEVASSATIGLTELAGAWAEHMPGTIPPDVLAAMAITGDHWSSRWWANQAAQVVSALTDLANNAIDLTAEFNKIYLGSKSEDPLLDNENMPLLVGALYFNDLTSVLRIWSGTIWASATGADSFVLNADNLGGGLEVFKDRVTGVLNFRTITVLGGLGATQTASEIQLTIDGVAWSKITGRPTTLAGYGIANAYTKAEIDAELDAAIGARATVAYVNSELDLVDAAIATKADSTATTAALGALTAAVNSRVVQTSDTGAALIPAGTTAQRDPDPGAGDFRFNITLKQWEGWNETEWAPVGGGGAIMSETPPTTNLRNGNFWVHIGIGALFVYYVDGDGTEQWMSLTPVVDSSLFFLKGDNLLGIGGDAALANLGANANGRDILKGASAIGKLLGLAADGAAGRTAIGAAPLPQLAAGVGQFVNVTSTYGAGFSLPSGGTWVMYYWHFNTAAQVAFGGAASVYAGGTSFAGVPNSAYSGFAWRIT